MNAEKAELLAREAVVLEMPTYEGMRTLGAGDYRCKGEAGWETWQRQPGLPDFTDRLTEKACELWVEDVAREVYGDKFYCVQFEAAVAVGAFEGGARAFAYAFTGEEPGMAARNQEGGHLWLPTRAEAAIAAVKAMRSAEARR